MSPVQSACHRGCEFNLGALYTGDLEGKFGGGQNRAWMEWSATPYPNTQRLWKMSQERPPPWHRRNFMNMRRTRPSRLGFILRKYLSKIVCQYRPPLRNGMVSCVRYLLQFPLELR